MRRQQSAAQPVHIVRQAAEAARSAAQNVDMAEVRDTITTQAVRAAEAARDAAQNIDIAEVRDTITTQAVRAAEAARDAAQNIDVTEVRDTITGEVAKDYELVLDETRRRPLRSLIIAVGVGALIGAVVDRMRRRRQAKSEATSTPSGVSQSG